MEETFGMIINDEPQKIKMLSQLKPSEILNLLPTAEIDKLAMKMEIQNVLHK